MSVLAGEEMVFCAAVESTHLRQFGHVLIIRLKDTAHVVRYVSSSHLLTADLDSMKVDVESKTVRISFDTPDPHNDAFTVADRWHLQGLMDAQRLCQQSCNLSLELYSRLEDIYLGSLEKVLESSNATWFQAELMEMQQDSAEKLWLMHNKQCMPVQTPAPDERLSDQTKIEVMNCFYCGTSSLGSTNAFYSHPYVPRTCHNQPVVMCEQCMSNWNLYREATMKENLLILDGETNEEICALCSSSPDTLVLCSTCQRSFCDCCLRRSVADEQMYQSIHESDDWRCPCCMFEVNMKPLLAREHWKKWNSKKSSKNKPAKKSKRKLLLESVIPSPDSHLDQQIAANTNAIASLTTVKSLVHSSSSRNKRSKQSQPVAPDEVFYFAQYVDIIIASAKAHSRSKVTDDSCFLCKDGGELIECDFCYNKSSSSRCLKVYHSYCLSYEVAEKDRWLCPRHFCSGCGSREIEYSCFLCPIAICKKCPPKLESSCGVKKYRKVTGLHLPEYQMSGIHPIVCHTCSYLLDQAKGRPGLLLSDLSPYLSEEMPIETLNS